MVAHRLIERQRLAAHLDNATSVVDRTAQPSQDLFRIRFATKLLNESGSNGSHSAIVSIMCTGKRIVRL